MGQGVGGIAHLVVTVTGVTVVVASEIGKYNSFDVNVVAVLLSDVIDLIKWRQEPRGRASEVTATLATVCARAAHRIPLC